MAHGSTVAHLNYLADVAIAGTATRPSTCDVLLYDDSADDLDDDPALGDIDTEPTDGNYSRASLDMDAITTSYSEPHVVVEAPNAEFDLTDTTGEVDSLAVIWTYDGADEIMIRQGLDGRYDLGDWSGVNTVGVQWKHAGVY